MILQKVVNRIATSFRLASPSLARTRATFLPEHVTTVTNSNCGPNQYSTPLRFVPTRPAPLPPYDMKRHVARVGHTIDKSAALGPPLASPPAQVLTVLAAASTKNDGESTAERGSASVACNGTDSPNQKRVKRRAPQPQLAQKPSAASNKLTPDKKKELAAKLTVASKNLSPDQIENMRQRMKQLWDLE